MDMSQYYIISVCSSFRKGVDSKLRVSKENQKKIDEELETWRKDLLEYRKQVRHMYKYIEGIYQCIYELSTHLTGFPLHRENRENCEK